MAVQNYINQIRPRTGMFSVYDVLGKVGNTLWLRADAGVYSDAYITPASDGTPVRAWQDFGFYGDHANQTTVSKQPIYHELGLNGLPIVSFSAGSRHSMPINNQANFNTMCQSIFVVGKWYGGSGFLGKGSNDKGPDGQSGGNTVIHRKMQLFPYADNLCVYWNGTDGNSATAGVIPAPNDRYDWNIYHVISIRNNLTYFNINGHEVWNNSPYNVSYFNTRTLALASGFYDYDAEYSTCDIAEVIILNYAIAKRTTDGLMNYLSTKWNIPLVKTNSTTLPSRSFAGPRADA